MPQTLSDFLGNRHVGPMGFVGSRGTFGQSAYQLAVQKGFSGTEQQWLDSTVNVDWQPKLNEKQALIAPMTLENRKALTVALLADYGLPSVIPFLDPNDPNAGRLPIAGDMVLYKDIINGFAELTYAPIDSTETVANAVAVTDAFGKPLYETVQLFLSRLKDATGYKALPASGNFSLIFAKHHRGGVLTLSGHSSFSTAITGMNITDIYPLFVQQNATGGWTLGSSSVDVKAFESDAYSINLSPNAISILILTRFPSGTVYVRNSGLSIIP